MAGHSVGPVDNVMDVICVFLKALCLDALKKFYIYRESEKCNQISDRHVIGQKKVFDIIIQYRMVP
jgi:hypothetical protein